MNGKDTIIQSIKDTASAKSNDLIAQAQSEKDELVKKEVSALEVACANLVSGANEQSKLIISRRVSVGKLEASKVMLSAKQDLIDTVYSQAKDKIVGLKDKEYCDFISGLLTKYAEDGDSVIIASNDAKRVTASLIDSVAKAKKIKLSLSKEQHACVGGIILSGSKYDKNLTLTAMLSQARTETESKTAQNLFGK